MKEIENIRAYMNIFAEYFTYDPKTKVMTLNFLYELLMHREGDSKAKCTTDWKYNSEL